MIPEMLWFYMHRLIHKTNKNEHPTKWRRTIYFMYNEENQPFWPGWTAKRELLDRYDSKKFTN